MLTERKNVDPSLLLNRRQLIVRGGKAVLFTSPLVDILRRTFRAEAQIYQTPAQTFQTAFSNPNYANLSWEAGNSPIITNIKNLKDGSPDFFSLNYPTPTINTDVDNNGVSLGTVPAIGVMYSFISLTQGKEDPNNCAMNVGIASGQDQTYRYYDSFIRLRINQNQDIATVDPVIAGVKLPLTTIESAGSNYFPSLNHLEGEFIAQQANLIAEVNPSRPSIVIVKSDPPYQRIGRFNNQGYNTTCILAVDDELSQVTFTAMSKYKMHP